MSKKRWIFNPRAANPKISACEKITIKQKCDRFIDVKLKIGKIKLFDPDNKKERQLIDIYCKWYRNHILFIAKYKDLRPNAIVPEYEDKFARITYFSQVKCYLYYMRHTGEWQDITYEVVISLNKCLQSILKMPHFEFY
ncbi:hypothetical protein KKA09_04360 [Patescibacteria group bacterium]|nr:hypothetical protein [Patescibacteria group bacterium]